MEQIINFTIDDDGIAVLELDIPGASMNVINEQMTTELNAAVDRIISEDAITGAVIISAKKDFVAGADLRMLQDMAARQEELGPEGIFENAFNLNQIFRKLETGGHNAVDLVKGKAFAKPVIAAVKGMALGGGFEIALACHGRVATNSAKFGLPEVQVGLLPGAGGTQRLPRMIGLQMAIQYITTGKNFKADEALGLNIVDALVDEADLLSKAKEMVKEKAKAVQPWDKKGFKYPGGAGSMNPKAVQLFMGATTMALKQSYGNYPAVKAIMSAIYEGSNLPFDKAIQVESKYFASLVMDPVAGNMIRTLFVNKQAAEKGMRRPKDVPASTIKKVAVLGAGLMGAGITHDSAKAGLEVILLDMNEEAAAKGKAYSEKLVKKAVSRKRMTQEKADAMLARIKPTTDYADLEGCDLIIEAVFEDVKIKAEVCAKTEAVVGADTTFGSNTSTLPITLLQKNWSRPDNFIGLHFFSPVEKMPLVEIILGEETGDEALAKALDYTRIIRKTPIVVNDSRGFYTSRSVLTYCDEGGRMLVEGVGAALVENCGRIIGYPMGPMQLIDSVNIDLGVRIARQTKEALGDEYDPGPTFDLNVKMSEEHGRLGMKNAKGYYDYKEGSPKPENLWEGLKDLYPQAEQQPDASEVKDRLIYRQVIECVKCLEENVLENPAEGDLGAIFGWGFPPFTGGPFSYVDTVGVPEFVARCEELAAAHGDRFDPPQILRDMVKEGRNFYGTATKSAAA